MIKYSGNLDYSGSKYFLTWDVTLELPANGASWNFTASGVDGLSPQFEMDTCVNDGSAQSPWNCIYTQISTADYETSSSKLTTLRKNVAESDRPSAAAGFSGVTTVSSPSCSVFQTFNNGAKEDGIDTVLGNKTLSGLKNADCELISQQFNEDVTKLTAKIVRNSVRITLAGSEA